jgi:hypothetical protein
MAGLIQQAKQAQPMPEEEDAGPEGEASPEEEAAMEAGLMAASELVYDDDAVNKAIVGMIGKGKPGQGAGEAAAMVVMKVDISQDLPETVIVPLGEAVLSMIVDLGESSGVMQPLDDAAEARAAQAMMKVLLSEYGEDPEGATELANRMGDKLTAPMQRMAEMTS